MVGTANRLANRFCKDGIVLSALNIRFDISCRHELHIMPKLTQLTAPMMG